MSNEYYILGAFEFLADLHILRGKLESEGIEVFLKDENIVNSDPLISSAIGGIKMQVLMGDKEKALAIYNEFRNYAVDDDGNPIVCPNCQAQKSEAYYSRKGIFYKLFPFFERKKYRCTQCDMITKPSP